MNNRWKAINYFVTPVIIVLFLDAIIGSYLDMEAFVAILIVYVVLAGFSYAALEGVKFSIKYFKEDK